MDTVDSSLAWTPLTKRHHGVEALEYRRQQVQQAEARVTSIASEQYDKGRMLRACLMPNVSVDAERVDGVTYVMHVDAPVKPLFQDMSQLGGTVSAYALGPKPHSWMTSARGALHELASRVGSASDAQIYDESFERGAAVSQSREPLVHPYHHRFDLRMLENLGPDAHIGLHTESQMSSAPHHQDPQRYLVVRTQFSGSRDWTFNPELTVSQLAHLREYRLQERLSQLNADHLAYRTLVALGEIDHSTGRSLNEHLDIHHETITPSVDADDARSWRYVKPTHVNRFNTLMKRAAGSDVPGVSASQQVVYVHAGALNTVHGGRGTRLLLAAGRSGGYLFVPVDTERDLHRDQNTRQETIRLQNATSLHSYPMSYPDRLDRSAAHESMATAPERLRLSREIANGAQLLDVQTLPALNYTELFRDDRWAKAMLQCGAAMDLRSSILALEGAFRTVPAMGPHVRIEELLEFHRSADQRVEVHIDHPFLRGRLMRAFAYARHADLTFDSLGIQQSGPNHLSMNADAVHEVMQRSAAALKLEFEQRQQRKQ